MGNINFSFLKSDTFLELNNNKIPAIVKTKNNNISNNFFSIGKDPPKKASGIEPIKYGIKSLRFKFPVLI